MWRVETITSMQYCAVHFAYGILCIALCFYEFNKSKCDYLLQIYIEYQDAFCYNSI